ncbi:hypothetical protein FTV88_2397 [Heliorestis convoluta]|uniref:Uncharacterized protein n=1 Tax=Heliorestis convoluta TaxID=356322 RepID=A0A5Q2N7N1_9FIRM|nr:hypothetical protein FTV88_2397 [Heliorestis convoluta]
MEALKSAYSYTYGFLSEDRSFLLFFSFFLFSRKEPAMSGEKVVAIVIALLLIGSTIYALYQAWFKQMLKP